MTPRYSSFFFALFLGTLFLTGCKTLDIGGNPRLDTEISPLQTFAVSPVVGNYDAIMTSDPQRVRQITRDSIIEKMTEKGYSLAGQGQTPDFVVGSQWMVSTQNNRAQFLNGGTVDTSRQIPELSRVASINITVTEGESGEEMWRDSSPWPFDVRYSTVADIQNSVSWALERFPQQMSSMSKDK